MKEIHSLSRVSCEGGVHARDDKGAAAGAAAAAFEIMLPR